MSIARWSKDPSRGVGAVIVSPSRQIVATGFNGLPRGIEDRPERLERPVKYDLICHAEMNAIIQCARNGVTPVGSTMYTSFAPCVHCTLSIIQSGIVRVVTYAGRHGRRALAGELREERASCSPSRASSSSSSRASATRLEGMNSAAAAVSYFAMPSSRRGEAAVATLRLLAHLRRRAPDRPRTRRVAPRAAHIGEHGRDLFVAAQRRQPA
jgi:deoxycytidylate deaminase